MPRSACHRNAGSDHECGDLGLFTQTTLVDTITLTDSVAAVAATSGTLADRMRVLTFSQLITDTIKRLHHPLDGSQ
ncbi:hypothetical protein [Pseudophaeobacter profundi]|uniref:hypothetical protein n=1 Tax=Pseudophaeobacter profundi TaxID=3034152 RepID=UPI002431CCE1|nr:hypothetical protein [Pseudophaeobacter profundi]